jgi:hypothetical protein
MKKQYIMLYEITYTVLMISRRLEISFGLCRVSLNRPTVVLMVTGGCYFLVHGGMCLFQNLTFTYLGFLEESLILCDSDASRNFKDCDVNTFRAMVERSNKITLARIPREIN